MSEIQTLLNRLIKDPLRFERGLGPTSLLERFDKDWGEPELNVLLASKNVDVQRIGMWIVSELGPNAARFICVAMRMSESESVHIRVYSLEVLLVHAQGKYVDQFWRVCQALVDKHEGIRLLAIGWISNADREQLRAALDSFSRSNKIIYGDVHCEGLKVLLGRADHDHTCELLGHSEPLLRKYGVIAAMRASERRGYAIDVVTPSEALVLAATSCDPEIRRFVLEHAEVDPQVD